MAAANTGVIKTSILIVKNKAIDMNGNNTLRYRKPGMLKVRRVINKFVNEIVVLTPANITPIIAISWLPTPVYFTLDENGVIKVHPLIVKVRLLHFVK